MTKNSLDQEQWPEGHAMLENSIEIDEKDGEGQQMGMRRVV